MTTIQATINSLPFGSAATRLDIWHEGGGIGHWELELDNITGASQILSANLVASNLGINGVDLMHGYVDDVLPEVKDASAVFSKYVKVTGRNYGRDLARLFLIYKFAAVKFDDLVHDALLWTGSEIAYTSFHTAPVVDADFNKTYLQNGLVDAAKLVDYDFVVDNAKTLFLWPLASAPYSGVLLKAVAGATDNNILLIDPETKAGVGIYNYVRADAGTLNDHFSEGNADNWTGSNCTVADDQTVFVVGASSIRATILTQATATMYLQFPKYNHQYLDFSTKSTTGSIWICHDFPLFHNIYIYAKDDSGNEIEFKIDVPNAGAWGKVDFNIGFGTAIEGAGWDTNKWYYLSGSSFTWIITRLGIDVHPGGSPVTGYHFWADGLKIDGVDVYAIAQDIPGSQATYGRSMIPITRTDVKSQSQLQDIADTELIVRKDPVCKLTLTCTLQTGLLYAGYLVDVLAPDAYIGYDSTPITYRILSIHHTAEPGADLCMGHDAITVLELIRHDGGVGADPTRFKLASSPQAAINTRYDSRLRVLEGSLTGSGSVLGGGGGGVVDWMNVPYIKVLGSAFFESLTQLECVCPSFTWAQLEPYIWGFDGQGNWTPDALELELGDAKLRFKDNTDDYYFDVGVIRTDMDASPILWMSHALMTKKDFFCGGFVSSAQGALFLGSGLQAEGDMPQIVLAHSESGYGTKNFLEINRNAIGTLHRARSSNVATIGTSSAHLLVAGDAVKIHGIGGSGYDGDWYVLAVPDSTHFTYSNTGGNEGETSALYGSVTGLAKLKAKSVYADNLKKVNGDDWSFTWNGGTVTGDIIIEKATPVLQLKNTSGNPELRFNDGANLCKIYGSTTGQKHLRIDVPLVCEVNLACNTLLVEVATGTVPIATNSITMCTHLNADRLDDHHWSDVPAAFNGGTITTPLTITSASEPLLTLNHADAKIQFYNDVNLYRKVVSSVPILATDNAFTCANLVALGMAGSSLGLDIATGTPPITVTSTTMCTNLNADRLDNHHASDFLALDAYGYLTISNGIHFASGLDLYVQTSTSPDVLEFNCGVIIDLSLNVLSLASTNQIGISVATGTAPINVNSTTVCTNLNADRLDGHHWSDVPSAWNGGTVTGDIIIEKATPILQLKNTSGNPELQFNNGANLCKIYGSTVTTKHLVIDVGLVCEQALSVGTDLAVTGVIGVSKADGTAPITTTSTTMCTNLNADRLDGHHWSDVPSAYITSVTSPLSVSSGVLSISGIGYGSTSFADQNLLKASNAIFNSVMATATAGAGLKLGLADGTTYGALAYEATKVNLIAYGRTLYLATDSGYGVEVQRNLQVDGALIFKPSTYMLCVELYTTNIWAFYSDYNGGIRPLMIQPVASAIRIGDGFKLTWGQIGYSDDTNLYRLSAGVLKTDGSLTLAGSLYGSGGVTTIGNDMVTTGNIKINKTNPVLNFDVADDLKLAVGFNGTYSFINEYTSGDLMISTLYGGGIILAPAGVSGTGDVRVWGGHHLLPQTVNTGQVGNSGFYFYAMYSNWFYGKNNGLFGCERSKSGQEWAHEFSTREQAEEYLTHELTKTKYHVEYNPENFDEILCTCGKSVSSPCPEHIDEWSDKYTVNTGKLVQAASFLVLELDAEVVSLRAEIDDLQSQLNSLKTLKGEVID